MRIDTLSAIRAMGIHPLRRWRQPGRETEGGALPLPTPSGTVIESLLCRRR